MENVQVDTGGRWAHNRGNIQPVIQSEDMADASGIGSIPCDFCPIPSLVYLATPQEQKGQCAGLGSAA